MHLENTWREALAQSLAGQRVYSRSQVYFDFMQTLDGTSHQAPVSPSLVRSQVIWEWARVSFSRAIISYLSNLHRISGKFFKCVLVTQLCLTLCDPMDCHPPGPVHRILQARILEWVVIPFSGGSSRPRDGTRGSCIVGRFFTIWATRAAPENHLKTRH